ncbi:MAG TPA: hypothetical protein VFL80_12205 [Thermoanaerobaculia bacterium]|nr:hypothetical protein [Thermoanaerobaculia bacterium]
MLRFVFAGAMVVAAGACMTPSGVTPVINVQPGRQFDLAVGQEAQIQGTSVNVRFSGVGEDSRCAIDVQCVWAGNAVVMLTLRSSDAPASESALNTTLDPKQTAYAGYNIRLIALKPAPKSGTPKPATEYVATLEVVN